MHWFRGSDIRAHAHGPSNVAAMIAPHDRGGHPRRQLGRFAATTRALGVGEITVFRDRRGLGHQSTAHAGLCPTARDDVAAKTDAMMQAHAVTAVHANNAYMQHLPFGGLLSSQSCGFPILGPCRCAHLEFMDSDRLGNFCAKPCGTYARTGSICARMIETFDWWEDFRAGCHVREGGAPRGSWAVRSYPAHTVSTAREVTSPSVAAPCLYGHWSRRCGDRQRMQNRTTFPRRTGAPQSGWTRVAKTSSLSTMAP